MEPGQRQESGQHDGIAETNGLNVGRDNSQEKIRRNFYIFPGGNSLKLTDSDNFICSNKSLKLKIKQRTFIIFFY